MYAAIGYVHGYGHDEHEGTHGQSAAPNAGK
jgi:hypothetical protein